MDYAEGGLMKIWARVRAEALRRIQALLRIFGRVTVERKPLQVLVPERVELPVLPLEQVIHEPGRELFLLGQEKKDSFPIKLYTDAFNHGPARNAEWAHLITADRELSDQVLGEIFLASPTETTIASPKEPGLQPYFLLHSTPDRTK
jgi:hypothetical protein